MSTKKKRNTLPLDSQRALKARREAVENGNYPEMPGLRDMKPEQMLSLLQSIWTLCDECEVNRLCEGVEMNLYGRVVSGFERGRRI